MKTAFMLGIIAGLLLGLLNAYVSKDKIPSHRFDEHVVLHMLLGAGAGVLFVVAMYIFFD